MAEPPKPPVAVAEPVPEVKRAERPGLLFGGHRPVPKTEPEVIEVVPESVARERAKQRKETEGTVQGTLGPDSTIVILEPQAVAPPVEPKKETRRTSSGSQRGAVTGTRTKSSGAPRGGRVAGETLVLPATPAPVVTEVPPAPVTIREDRNTKTETREAPRVGATTTKRTSSSSRNEIEQLQEKVKDLEQEVAQARREPQKVIAKPHATAAAESTPLQIPPTTRDERQPLVVDTPPPTTAVTTKTETVRTGSADTVVTSEVPAENPKVTKETQETAVTSEPPPPLPAPAPQPPPTEAPKKVDTSEAAQTTPPPTTDASTEPASQPEAKVTTTAPGKIDKLPSKSDVPAAEKTDKAGFVKSPFPPHNLIDVTGLTKGSLAKDPTTMKVFRVP